jgi:hypothetical protein
LWKSPLSRSALNKLAALIAIVGGLAVIAIHASAVPVCDPHDRRDIRLRVCLDESEGGSDEYITGLRLQGMVTFDTAQVVVLLLVQARQASGRSGENEGTDPMSALGGARD